MPFPSAQRPSTSYVLPALALLGISALLITALGEWTDLDLLLADLYYDANRGKFPWDTTWFARDFMHGWVKNVLIWGGFTLFGITLYDLAKPIARLNTPQRAAIRVASLAAFLEPLLIRTLKGQSALHCPWGIDRYGGSAPFLRLLDTLPPDWAAGHCFPAGHASSAMWLSALAAFWLPHNPKRARLVFFAGIGAGFVLGWVQQMRGQHFLSHTLWTAWLSSALIVGLIYIFSRDLGLRRAGPPASAGPLFPVPRLVYAESKATQHTLRPRRERM